MTALQRRLVQVCGRHPHGLLPREHATPGPLDVDARQLAAGIKVEAEHTGSRRVACKIALAHLGERGDYYTRLKRAKL